MHPGRTATRHSGLDPSTGPITNPSRDTPMTMSKHEIERALIELRLSGMAATLETRLLQAQASEQPFLETFCMLLQDEIDRRRSRLTERRFKQCGLDERLTLADFDWHFNPCLLYTSDAADDL